MNAFGAKKLQTPSGAFADVGFDGVLGDAELLSDLFLRESVDFSEREDLPHFLGKRKYRLAAHVMFEPPGNLLGGVGRVLHDLEQSAFVASFDDVDVLTTENIASGIMRGGIEKTSRGTQLSG
jgi:hypothetical protein